MNKVFHLSGEDTVNNQIDFVAPMYIPEIFYRVEDMLCTGLAKMEDMLSLAEIYHRLACGEMILWTVQRDHELKGIALTEVGAFLDGQVCFIYFVTGDDILTWMEELHEEIVTWAQTHGCRKVKALGRPGWKKFYKNFGWHISAYEYALPIKNVMH